MKQKKKKIDNIIQDLKSISTTDNPNKESLDSSIENLKVFSQDCKKEFKERKFLYIAVWLLLLGIIIVFNLLMDRNSVLESKINYVESQLKYMEYRDSTFVDLMGLETDSIIVFKTRNGIPITYKQLSEENDSITQERDSIATCLKVILRNYPIKIKTSNSYFWAISPQIDSALMLLPVFRDKIKYNEKEKVWSIRR